MVSQILQTVWEELGSSIKSKLIVIAIISVAVNVVGGFILFNSARNNSSLADSLERVRTDFNRLSTQNSGLGVAIQGVKGELQSAVDYGNKLTEYSEKLEQQVAELTGAGDRIGDSASDYGELNTRFESILEQYRETDQIVTIQE